MAARVGGRQLSCSRGTLDLGDDTLSRRGYDVQGNASRHTRVERVNTARGTEPYELGAESAGGALQAVVFTPQHHDGWFVVRELMEGNLGVGIKAQHPNSRLAGLQQGLSERGDSAEPRVLNRPGGGAKRRRA